MNDPKKDKCLSILMAATWIIAVFAIPVVLWTTAVLQADPFAGLLAFLVTAGLATIVLIAVHNPGGVRW